MVATLKWVIPGREAGFLDPMHMPDTTPLYKHFKNTGLVHSPGKWNGDYVERFIGVRNGYES